MKMLFALLIAGAPVAAFAQDFSLVRQVEVATETLFLEDHTQAPGGHSQEADFIPDALAPAAASFELAPAATVAPMAICVTPKVAIDCCNYTFRDGNPSKDVNYQAIKEVYGSEADSRNFAAGQVPRMAFFLPYPGDDAVLGGGWLYNNGDSHGSLDFGKKDVADGSDPSFKILAAGSGRVVSKVWDNWHGNVLTIEHTAGNGQKYRTLYFHLRNGKAADLANARAIVPPDPSKVDQWTKYSKFSKLKNPSDLHWGTESHKILVNVGDWVNAGQLIAYSGNTGVGGASAGLKDDGTPFDSTRANNHLHFMLAVPNPKDSARWIFIDAFGFYEKASSGCQDLMKENQYARFFAPFYANFHNINSDLFFKYFGYYANMGLGIQTFSMYSIGGQVKVAGAYADVKGPWLARGYLTTNDFNNYFNQHAKDGFRPRELSVSLDGQGQPRFSAVWKKLAGELYAVWINMSDADFNARWNDLVVNQKFRVEDIAVYNIGGQRRSAAIFVKDNQPFYFYSGLTGDAFNAKFQELLKLGFVNTSFNAALPGGDRFAGVWTKPGGQWATYYGMDSAGYQSRFNQLGGQGFRLHKVQGYSNGRFGAIWRK